MTTPTYYTWDELTMIYSGEEERQIDPLETELAGHDVYCGLPANATDIPPLEVKEGFNIVWNGEEWEYQEWPGTIHEQEPTELDLAIIALGEAHAALDATDYRALKYVDGDYTEEEYAVYRAEREALREAVREAQRRVDELSGENNEENKEEIG